MMVMSHNVVKGLHDRFDKLNTILSDHHQEVTEILREIASSQKDIASSQKDIALSQKEMTSSLKRIKNILNESF